jgi:putative transposase
MAVATVDQCRQGGGVLHAFAVMPHHVHLLYRLPANRDASRFTQILKPRVADAVMPHLSATEIAEFREQLGLNGNTFWQRSFRSLVVETESIFWQKVEYIHSNPVEGNLVEGRAEYRWSSARFHEQSLWTEEAGLPYDLVIRALREGT